MITAWTKHIRDDPEGKEQFERRVRSAKWILDHQASLLREMDQTFERAELSPRAYDQPNWEYRQAHSYGYRQALQSVLKLITLDHEEQHDRSIQPSRPA